MAFFLGFLAFLPLVADFGDSRPYEPAKIALFEGAVLLAFIAAVIAAFREPEAWRGLIARSRALDVAVAIFFISLAIGSIFSVDPVRSFFGSEERRTGLLFYACLTAAYYLIRFGVKAGEWRVFIRSSSLAVLAAAAYGVAQGFGFDVNGLRHSFPLYGITGPERAFSTIGHPLFLGAYLAMVASLLLAQTLDAREDRSWRIVAAVALSFSVLATAFTYSRTAWLAYIIGLSVFAVLRLPRTPRAYARLLTFAGSTFGTLVIVLLIVKPLLLRSPDPFLYRLGSAASLAEGSGLVRVNDWRYAVSLLPERPLTGYGLDTYMQFAASRPKDPGERNRDFREVDPSISDRIHNIFLDTAWAGGILAVAALLFLLYAAGRAARTALVAAPRQRLKIAACIGGLAAYLTANQLAFDFSMNAILASVFLAGIAASVDA